MKWHREPLVHFLALGVGLFLLHGAVAEPAPDAAAVHLTAGHVDQLRQGFQRTWQRPPTEAELDGLIKGRVREEILYREALAMGLDRDDTIVRRRLRQKIEFIFEDIVALAQPTEADLAGYIGEQAEKYRRPSSFSFRHVFLSPDRRGAAVRTDAEQLLAELAENTAVDTSTLGDPFHMVQDSYASLPEGEVAKIFGPGFAERLAQTSPGRWAGPVESGYGLHLVYVRERLEGEVPELDEIRAVVERDWLAQRRTDAAESYYEGLLKRYTVNVERPEQPAVRHPEGGQTQKVAEVRP